MINKRMMKSAVIITVAMLSLTACGKQEQPVSAEPTETVSEEESTEESLESVEPTPSPTVTPTTEPAEESSSSEESLDNTENEIDTTEDSEEVTEGESESTGIEIVEELDKTMYAQQNCNARSGDSTDFEKVTSMTKGASVHVTGRTSNNWYRVEWNNEVVYISGSLLADTAPTQPSSNGNGSTGNTETTPQQPSGGNDKGTTQQPSESPDINDILDSIFGPDRGATLGGPDAGKLPGQ